MTRPHIIRADTIDLQDQHAPSAKNHTNQLSRPTALGEGPPAPHQADALKHVELELNEQHGRSPRASQDLSGKELQLLQDENGEPYNDTNANENLLRNAGQNGPAEEDLDGVDGDDADDDLMDKISSSPSIGDDGGYPLPLPWPRRVSTLRSSFPQASSPNPLSDEFSSSPFAETPEHFPLSFPRNEQEQTPSKDHHQKGEYFEDMTSDLSLDDEYESEKCDRLSPLVTDQDSKYFRQDLDSFDSDSEHGDLQNLLLPADDPLLDNSFDDAPLESGSESASPSKSSWEDEATGEPDDDTEDISFVDDTRFIDSGWGGECLRETEDIDFEFVYALHTFVATVEGQANATKGETMVLLDDSNSYWWLVRVVKDSSIGYLPAEHIETPLERLARLNKHRNLDLSQTMLGDQEEDKKGAGPLNPLKKAMRRRNVKTVQFTAPSYVEPSENEYSSDEDEEGDGEYGNTEQDIAEQHTEEPAGDDDDTAAAAPLNTRDRTINNKQTNGVVEPEPRPEHILRSNGPESIRSSDEMFEHEDDGISGKSRKGTVRNTDSFFKDDSVETRKINLTPSLLREDSNGGSVRSSEAKDLKTRASLDSLEKDATTEKTKDDKKKKEKRGMLGGMFKRKDKKTKSQDKDVEESEKISSDLSRQSPTPKESLESLSTLDSQNSKLGAPHRQTSKLQKSPPTKLSPKSSYAKQFEQRPSTADQQNGAIPEPSRPPPPISNTIESMRLVQPDPVSPMFDSTPTFGDTPTFQDRPAPLQVGAFEHKRDEPAPLQFKPQSAPEVKPLSKRPEEESYQSNSPKNRNVGMFSPFVNALKPASAEPKPERTHKAKERIQMDDFDSSSDDENDKANEPSTTREINEEPPSEDDHLSIAQKAQHNQHETNASIHTREPQSTDRLSESPIQVPSQAQPQEQQQQHHQYPSHRPLHQPPPLVTDASSPSSRASSPDSPISSPELIDAPTTPHDDNGPTGRDREETPASTAGTYTSTSTTPTWSDASLRAYMENDGEIRDLLVVVHDKSGVKGRRDHPVVKNLYREENRRLGEISNRLDGLLGDYLARRSRTATPVR